MDVIRLARKCQAANNLDVVQKDVNPFLVMKQMDRNLLWNCEAAAAGKEVASSPTPSFQTFFQAISMWRCDEHPLTSRRTSWQGTRGRRPRPASPQSRWRTSCTSSNNLSCSTFRTFSSTSTTGLPAISFLHWRWPPCIKRHFPPLYCAGKDGRPCSRREGLPGRCFFPSCHTNLYCHLEMCRRRGGWSRQRCNTSLTLSSYLLYWWETSALVLVHTPGLSWPSLLGCEIHRISLFSWGTN